MMVATLITLGMAAVILYAWAAGAAFENLILRSKAQYPDLKIDTSDLVFLGFMAAIWPLGWSLSYATLPSLKSYTRPKNHRSLNVDAWATRELLRRNIKETDQ